MPLEQYLERAEQYTRQRMAKNTRRQYGHQVRAYERWCVVEQVEPWPLDADKLCAHLAWLADNYSVSTVEVARYALLDRVPELRGDIRVLTLMRGVRRVKGVMKRQMKGLSYADWQVIRTLDQAVGKQDIGFLWRDIALVGAMRDLMLRQSEAVALVWGDVDFQEDGGALVTIRYSKTDPEGEGAVRYMGVEATRDLKRWRDYQPRRCLAQQYAQQDPGRVFGITRPDTVCPLIKRLCERAGLSGLYGGHSPRIGMCEDLSTMEGVTVTALQYAGRWRSPEMPMHYIRGMEARRGPVHLFHQRMSEAAHSVPPRVL